MASKARWSPTGDFCGVHLSAKRLYRETSAMGWACQEARAAVITIRTRSAAFLAPSFFMMFAR
jgi:hypothetical protein